MSDLCVIESSANAKINLFLRVCGTLPNGYHRLFTLMQEIDLADTIEITIDPDREFDIDLDCGDVDIAKEKNLCYKAAVRFYDKLAGKRHKEGMGTDDFYHTTIRCVKNIPSEAGLGGGSSDAAMVINMLSEVYDNPLDRDELIRMSVGIGADVPFLLFGGSSICEGVGEDIKDIPSLKGLGILLIKPEQGVSTAVCFNEIDSCPVSFDEEDYKKKMWDIFGKEGDAAGKIRAAKDLLTDDLQIPAVKAVHVIADLVEILDNNGSIYSSMTGSGSAVFGVFESKEKAALAKAAIEGSSTVEGMKLFVTQTL